MAIQACGVIAAIICGYLMLVNTFGSSAKAEGRVGQRPGLPRSAGRLYRGLGRHRDDHLGALR